MKVMELTTKEFNELNTIEEQKKIINILESNLKELKESINKENVFTQRELNFSKDSAQEICNKYNNKKYEIKKSEILSSISKKFEKNSKTKLLIDKNDVIYKKFFEELKATEEGHLHIKESTEIKAA